MRFEKKRRYSDLPTGSTSTGVVILALDELLLQRNPDISYFLTSMVRVLVHDQVGESRVCVVSLVY